MDGSHIRILIVGVTKSVPTFILRRLVKLDQYGVKVVLIGDPRRFQNFKNLTVFPYQNISIRSPMNLLVQLVKFFVRIKYSVRLWGISNGNLTSRLKWCLENQRLVALGKFDIVHFQWFVAKNTYAIFNTFYPGVKIVASARGSQLTVYPFTDLHSRELVKINFNEADYIHCVSRDIAKSCLIMGVNDNKLFVNYNGIDLKKFTPKARYESNSARLFLISVGALMWRKGYYFQLQIIKELNEKGLDTVLRIVGSGFDLQGLQYTAFRLGILDKIIFEGQLSEDEVIDKLHEADIYLSTSSAEGLPNSLVEAGACGLPIVAFACEGVQEIIENEVTGYIVQYGNVNEAVRRIFELQNRAHRREMGDLSSKRMQEMFDEDYWVKDMINRYKAIGEFKFETVA